MKTIFAWLISLVFLGSDLAYGGTYLNSAHGTENGGITGVNRLADYTDGHCAHCHEQHASLNGVSTGADNYLLFNTRSTNVSGSAPSGFCFDCHGGSEDPGITINRSYSKNFGGKSTVDDSTIAAQFNHTASGSSHYLPDFVSQILGESLYTADNMSWSLNANLDPCDACHNPHIAKRNYPVAFEDTTILKTAISRPSDHDNLWGDGTDERMSSYNYQPPYWDSNKNSYEPDENATAATSKVNTPDYITYCTDCHNPNNTITSTNPRIGASRSLRQIDWSASGDKHGLAAAEGEVDLDAPFSSDLDNKVLCCTDCHEPHGSTDNVFLIRTEVNDTNLDDTITTFATANWRHLCNRCHKDDAEAMGGTAGRFNYIHHNAATDFPYDEMGCGSDCHYAYPIRCSDCHYHGSSIASNIDHEPFTRTTF